MMTGKFKSNCYSLKNIRSSMIRRFNHSVEIVQSLQKYHSYTKRLVDAIGLLVRNRMNTYVGAMWSPIQWPKCRSWRTIYIRFIVTICDCVGFVARLIDDIDITSMSLLTYIIFMYVNLVHIDRFDSTGYNDESYRVVEWKIISNLSMWFSRHLYNYTLYNWHI